jgi:endo-1,4-beta-mannosidase
MNPQPFVLGVNYWPRRKAMYAWSDFDRGEIDDEFAIIAAHGLGLVRIFLLWDDFQPTPDRVSTAQLDHLVTVCDLADRHRLRLDITFFTGHMSGPNWAPRWLLEGPPLPRALPAISGGQLVNLGYRNPFTDPLALKAEALLLKTTVGVLRQHPAVGIWNLGNEPDLFACPPNAATGRTWIRQMTRLIHDLDPDHPVTCGLHVDSLLRDNGLRVTDVFAETDLAVMHAYPMYAPGWARAPLDPDFVPFTCALTKALAGKPALMEEFGGCTASPGQPSTVWRWTAHGEPREQFMAAEEDLAHYFAQVLPKLVEVGALGAVAWCFADYDPRLWDKPPCDHARHERFFGLVRPDGSLKPHAQVLKDFAARKPTVQTSHRQPALEIAAEEYYQSPASYAGRLYAQWVS